MSVSERGFSLLEVLIAMVISSILLLSAARFLPALQREILHNTRQLVLEDELWQRIYTVAKHLQRAGYCRGNCIGEGLMISAAGDCVIVRWDANSNGVWDDIPAKEADVVGFRVQDKVLETLRGATTCVGKGWDKMATQCRRYSTQGATVCLRVLDDDLVLLIAQYEGISLWRQGMIIEGTIEFSAHGWSDFCPLKVLELCLIP